jgi:hypothetical protein
MIAKNFFLGALCAAGLSLTAAAQTNPVYSVNAVGYVKLSFPANSFTLICNPLNVATNGINNNSLNTIIPTAAVGSVVYKFASGGFDPNPPIYTPIGWIPNTTLEPGEGAFFYTPVATNFVFAGEVLQGSLTNVVPAGFSILASKVPQGATLSQLGYPAAVGDTVYLFDPVSNTYDPNPPTFTPIGWFPGNTNGPTVAPGTSFWISNLGGARNWVRSFSVNP